VRSALLHVVAVKMIGHPPSAIGVFLCRLFLGVLGASNIGWGWGSVRSLALTLVGPVESEISNRHIGRL